MNQLHTHAIIRVVPAANALNRVEGFDPLKLVRRLQSEQAESEAYRLDLPYQKLWLRLACPNGRMELNRLRITDQLAIFEAAVFSDKGDDKPLAKVTASATAGDSPNGRYIQAAQDILGRMNVVQVYNYMRRQMSESCMDARTMLTTWQHYLNMAASFHYNVNDEIVYRAAKLKQRHDELVERSRDKSIAVRTGKLLQTFPHIDEICRSLAEKYNYVGKDYAILAPTCLRDILKEGDTLHHCIASSDRYVERIERQESYLLFLRRSEAPEQAYYTMEVEPNGTVRQIRTMYDRQNEDIDDAKQFLHEWQAVVAMRLTEDDRAKAARSRALREQEFLQLRRDQIRINHGDLSGRLLVEVLTADLLESAA